jgi:hypothetical protein
MHPELTAYLEAADWPTARQERMVKGLRALQTIAASGDRPVTYKQFAQHVQPGLASLATGAILTDIGEFCNASGWPNLTCFVVSATTGEVADGFTKLSDQDPKKARDAAWFAYAVYKNGVLVDA